MSYFQTHIGKITVYSCLLGMLLLTSCRKVLSPLLTPDTASEIAVLKEVEANHLLRPFVQILFDSIKDYSIDALTASDQALSFYTYSNYPSPFQVNQAYWGKIKLRNAVVAAEDHQEWILSFSTTWTELEIYTQMPTGHWQAQTNGSFVPEQAKEFVPTAQGNHVRITLPPQEVVTVYFRGKSERLAIPPSFHLYAQHTELFYQKLLQEKKKNALFAGLLLMMLFYNLIMYFFGRERSFLYYSGYLLAVLIYAGHTSDDLSDWFGYQLFAQHPAYLNLLKVVIYLGLMSYLAFIISFLDLPKLLPRWARFFRWIILAGIPWMLAYLGMAFYSNFSYALEDRITVPYIALVSISCFIFLYPLLKTHDKKGYFVVAGVGIISLGFLLTIISRLSTAPFSLDYLMLAAAIEILIFSLGLAYRQRRVEQARQQTSFALRESQLLQEKKELEAARLKELNEFKARFYTNITHEFRTPLTVIMGMSDQIKGHEQEKKLIRRNTKNLLQLISQLLDFSKLESKSLKLKLVHQDILVFLQYLTESFYSNAMQKQIRLVFYSEEAAIEMDYDEEKVQQIVYNLLSNALKFTGKTGRIIFHASQTERAGQAYLQLKVKDTGSGIPSSEVDRIFDRFYQVDQPSGYSPTGTGIGLAFTKELVELMGGQINVKSEEGVGSTFTIYLPIYHQAAASSLEPLSATTEETMESIPYTSSVETEARDLPLLLIIEDNPDIITYIKTVVRNDYQCHTAQNGTIGVEQAFELVPDIIISDVMMPEKDGYEVCDILKQDARTSHIPIVLLTAKSTQPDKLEGFKHGADAYLTKPFDKEELRIRLQQLIATRQRMQARYADGQIAKESEADFSAEDAFIQALHDHIAAHLNDTHFGVPELAATAHLSQMQLYRKLKALSGKTPSRFIRAYRLSRAKELLKTSDLTISEVAYEVGFADPSYFSRTFHQEFGQSPSDFSKKG